MRVLVTGGAGYIGSHMVKLLADSGAEVTVIDDLSAGHADAVRGAELVRGDIAQVAPTARLLRARGIEAVVHFAGAIQVAESVANPAKYRARNVDASVALLQAMREASVDRIVFSSSAAVYGQPQRLPIDEEHPKQPVNPYGESKLVVERKLAESSAAYGLKSASLRYFNAAGADAPAGLGERHEPETHLIPLVLKAAINKSAVSVFGNDYPTRDGTCVRDYIHVTDLCVAHLRALEWLERAGRCDAFNLGNGEGFTVMEVIEAAQRVTGRRIEVLHAQRRAGDPPALVADASKAGRILGWQPRHTGIESIVRDAWAFERRLAQ
jgi:UDP-glucose 4-epimerase